MMTDDDRLRTTLERIAWLQDQVTRLRETELNAVNYLAAVSGFLAEIDRMEFDVDSAQLPSP